MLAAPPAPHSGSASLPAQSAVRQPDHPTSKLPAQPSPAQPGPAPRVPHHCTRAHKDAHTLSFSLSHSHRMRLTIHFSVASSSMPSFSASEWVEMAWGRGRGCGGRHISAQGPGGQASPPNWASPRNGVGAGAALLPAPLRRAELASFNARRRDAARRPLHAQRPGKSPVPLRPPPPRSRPAPGPPRSPSVAHLVNAAVGLEQELARILHERVLGVDQEEVALQHLGVGCAGGRGGLEFWGIVVARMGRLGKT